MLNLEHLKTGKITMMMTGWIEAHEIYYKKMLLILHNLGLKLLKEIHIGKRCGYRPMMITKRFCDIYIYIYIYMNYKNTLIIVYV
jgi:hypothetical protein